MQKISEHTLLIKTLITAQGSINILCSAKFSLATLLMFLNLATREVIGSQTSMDSQKKRKEKTTQWHYTTETVKAGWY